MKNSNFDRFLNRSKSPTDHSRRKLKKKKEKKSRLSGRNLPDEMKKHRSMKKNQRMSDLE